jgi:hypothetical protein
MDETREEVEDKAPDTKDVTDEAKSRVVSAGQRVADAAKSEAEKQKLGTPSA